MKLYHWWWFAVLSFQHFKSFVATEGTGTFFMHNRAMADWPDSANVLSTTIQLRIWRNTQPVCTHNVEQLNVEQLHSNLRPTTLNCVRLVTCGHHLICHSRKPHAAHKLHGSMFYRTVVIADQSFTLWELVFPIILLLWPRPWPNYLCVRTWPISLRDTPDVQKWPALMLSKVIVLRTDISICRPKLYSMPFRWWSDIAAWAESG